MQLKTENGRPTAVMNFEEVRDALSKLNENGNSFAILEDGERFIQSATDGTGMVVEKNDGSRDQHYRASRNGSEKFSLPDVEAIFRSWFDGLSSPPGVDWAKIDVRGMPRSLYWLLWTLPWLGGAYIVYGIVRSSFDVWKLFR